MITLSRVLFRSNLSIPIGIGVRFVSIIPSQTLLKSGNILAFQITHVTSRRVKENTTKGDAKSPNQVPDKAMKDRDRLDAFRPTTPGHSPGAGH
ncbi:hypothetical protein R6Q59_020196 [Mikania micrantha]